MNRITEENLMSLVDNMASAASDLNNHTYDQFVRSREELKEIFAEIIERLPAE